MDQSEDRCICGALAWLRATAIPTCAICGLVAGATELEYAALTDSHLPAVAHCPIPAAPVPHQHGVANLRVKHVLADAPEGLTLGYLLHRTGLTFDELQPLLLAALRTRRVHLTETGSKMSQGEKVSGAHRYRLVGAAA